MNPIVKLSKNVKDLLSSSNQINSITRAVQELIYNSLDAKATSIAVRVYIEEGFIQVVDNGIGINKNDFKVLGLNHMTSKVPDISTLKTMPNTYGFRGQALASVIQVSKCVKITSRCNKSEDTFTKLFEYGSEKNIVKCKVRPSAGTTVEIKGFLYNISVQKKCLNNVTDLQEIKSFIQYTSLVQYNVSMSLRDDSTNEIVFKIHKNRDIYQTLFKLFDIEKSDVQELQVEKNQYKVTAYIGKDNNDAVKHLIFLNGKILAGHSKVHKIVDRYISKLMKTDKGHIRKVEIVYDKEEEVQANDIPFYIIFLKCPYDDYYLNNTSKHTIIDFKDWNQVNKLIEKLIQFYTGDITVKEINQMTKNPQSTNKTKSTDTRNQVQQIIDKILGSKHKVSQLHYGVKGKHIKRKEKKKLKLIELTSKMSKSSKPPNLKQQISSEVESVRRQRDTFLDDKEIANQMEKPINNKNNETIQQFKNKKSRTAIQNSKLTKPTKRAAVSPNLNNELKHQKKNIDYNFKVNKPKNKTKKHVPSKTALHNKFINPTDSLKQRCQILASKANNIKTKRNKTGKKQRQEVFVKETIEYENVKNTNKTTSIRNKMNEIIIYDYIPIPPKTNSKRTNVYDVQSNKQNKSFLSTYDILNTILSTQTNVKEHNSYTKNIETKRFENQNQVINQNCNYSTHISPIITFESHNYNKKNVGYASHKKQNYILSPINENIVFKKPKAFLSKKSIENFAPAYEDKRNRFKRKSCLKVNSKTTNWLKDTLKKAFNERHLNNGQNNIQNSKEQPSCTIQFSESDNYNFSNYNINSALSSSSKNSITMNIEQSTSAYTLNHTPQFIHLSNNQMISNYLFESEEFLRSVNKHLSNKTLSVHENENIVLNSSDNRTRTLESDSFNISTNKSVAYVKNCDKSIIHATYTINHETNISFKEKDTRDSEPEHVENLCSSQNELRISDPIQVCETVIASHELLNDEFQKSFNVRNDSLNVFVNNNIPSDAAANLETNTDKNDKNEDTNLKQISHHFNVSQIPCHVENDSDKNYAQKETELDEQNNGNDVYTQNNETIINNNFNIQERLCFLPKGMSQIFKNCNSKVNNCNQNSVLDYYDDRIYNEFAFNVQNTVEIFEPRVQEASDLVTKDIDKVNTKLKKDSASLKFDGKSIKNATVLAQVDQKFIAAVIKGDNETNSATEFLVLFDQHAVHERLRLETNLKDYLTDGQWKSVSLEEITLKMASDDIRFLHNYREKFSNFGLEWNILNNKEISISAIPEAILGKNARPVDKIIKAVQNLIKEIINTIKLQSGCVPIYPKAIMDLIFSEACRYAIKFGDQLSKNECVDLLRNLSECKTPFQCAHGRPVMAVITDIRPVNLQYKISPEKLMKFKGYKR